MKWIKRFLLGVAAALMVLPFIFVAVGATHDSGWAFRVPFDFSIGSHFIANWHSVARLFNIFRVVMNSVFVGFLTATLSVIVIYTTAYAFKKYSFRYKKMLYSLFLSSVFVPMTALLVGQLRAISFFGIYGTFLGIVLPFVINIRVFHYLNNMCDYIPNDLIEAARIDGASETNIMVSIATPLILDKLFLAFFILYVTSWNNFIIPMITLTRKDRFTLPVMISSLADPLRYDVGATFLALLFSIIPVVVLFIIIRNRVFGEVV